LRVESCIVLINYLGVNSFGTKINVLDHRYIISARINIIDFTVFPQIRNLKMKGNSPFGNTGCAQIHVIERPEVISLLSASSDHRLLTSVANTSTWFEVHQ
jgi:hypothetical protein